MVERVHQAFTARQEKRLLIWIADRLPSSATPNQLTAFGVFGSALSFLGYVASWGSADFLWLASAGLIVQWFGDSIDGTLARVRRIERPLVGFMLDHGTDLLSQCLFAIGFGLSPYLRLDCALLALVGYLCVCVTSYLRLHVTGALHLSYGKIGPTEIRLLLIAANTILYFTGPSSLRIEGLRFGVPDLAALAIFVFGIASAFTGVRTTIRQLVEAEAIEPRR